MAQRAKITRPAALRLYIGVVGVLWCSIPAVVVVASFPSKVTVLFLLILAFGGTTFYRALRLGAIADENGLLVHNHYQTKRFAWSDIEDFQIGVPVEYLPYTKCVNVLLRNGQVTRLDITMYSRAKVEANLTALRSWIPGQNIGRNS